MFVHYMSFDMRINNKYLLNWTELKENNKTTHITRLEIAMEQRGLGTHPLNYQKCWSYKLSNPNFGICRKQKSSEALIGQNKESKL